jgi:hypothetical protein
MEGQGGAGDVRAGHATATPGLVALAHTLAVDATTAEVIGALRDAGVDPVLLKGPVLAQWLYDEGDSRPYVDADLLISPPQHAEAERILKQLGFTQSVRPWENERRVEHDSVWQRPGDAGVVDLHRSLPGVRGVSPETLWRHIWPGTIDWRMPAPGGTVRVLDEPARALLVALHAAHHLAEGRVPVRPLADLERALARTPLATWEAAAVLARRLRAGPHFARGLHAVSGGDVLAARLGLPAPSSGYEVAEGIERLAAARGIRPRLRLLIGALWPSPSYLRWSSSLARRGPVGLGVAYLIRPAIVLVNAWRGYRTWRRQRRVRPGCSPPVRTRGRR